MTTAERGMHERTGAERESGGAPSGGARRPTPETILQVRASDIEPYTGLRYLSKLFRIMAIVLVLLLIAEVVTGLISQGTAALPTLLAEASKLIVSAALLWASGDLAILLIDVGHDVRATRILLGRQATHHAAELLAASQSGRAAADPAGAQGGGAPLATSGNSTRL